MFEKLRVLVIGDVMLDRYWMGTVDRISPEAPVPVLLLQQEDIRLGGAANVALNLRALGVHPFLLSITGNDPAAQQLCERLNNENIDSRYILFSPIRKTTVKTRMMAKNHQILRLDEELNTPLAATDEQALLESLAEIMDSEHLDAIILQDYNKGVLTPVVIDAILNMARQKSVPIVVDPKSDNFFRYKGVAVFKPNLREVTAALGWSGGQQLTQTELDTMGNALQQQLQGALIMITLGDKGVYVKPADVQTGIWVPAIPRRIADVCGAGDAVASVVAAATALQMSAYHLALLANIAGGMVCEQVGVCTVEAGRLIHEFTALQHNTPQ